MSVLPTPCLFLLLTLLALCKAEDIVTWSVRTQLIKVPYFIHGHQHAGACPVFCFPFGHCSSWAPPLDKSLVERRVSIQAFLFPWPECHHHGIQTSLWPLNYPTIYQDSWLIFILNYLLISPTHLMKSQTFILTPSVTLLLWKKWFPPTPERLCQSPNPSQCDLIWKYGYCKCN